MCCFCILVINIIIIITIIRIKIPGSWRKVLGSLKVDISVRERNIAVAVPSENCLLLSTCIFFCFGARCRLSHLAPLPS